MHGFIQLNVIYEGTFDWNVSINCEIHKYILLSKIFTHFSKINFQILLTIILICVQIMLICYMAILNNCCNFLLEALLLSQTHAIIV